MNRKQNNSEILINLYSNVKEIAKQKGLQLGDIERMAGLSVGYLSRKRNCSVEKIGRIADALGTTIETLISEPHSTTVTKLHDFFIKLAVETKSAKQTWHWTSEGMTCKFCERASVLMWEEKEHCYCVDMIIEDNRESLYSVNSPYSGSTYIDNAVARLYEIAEESARDIELNPWVRDFIMKYINEK